MKALLVLIMAALVAVLAVGCISNLKIVTEPKLGVYSYSHKDKYEGAPVRTIPIWIDKNFGAADKVEIDKAVDAWNFAMNGYVVLKVVDTNFDMEVEKIVEQVTKGGWLFMKIESTNKLVPAQDEKGYWTIGFCEQVGGHHMYLVRDRLQNQDVFGVTLHEIGHLMGSPHTGQRLMYPHYTRARFQCIDYDTQVKVAKFFDVPLSGLNYCVDDQPAEAPVNPEGGTAGGNCPEHSASMESKFSDQDIFMQKIRERWNL